MKYKIAAFFANRNGLDDLSKTLVWSSLIVLVISVLVPSQGLSSALYGISLAGFIYGYFRAFSRNLEKRQAENNGFLSWKSHIKLRWTQRKTHRFYHCPKCRTTLRVPKGKGKINITCRSCGEKFIKKT